jgi:hypothetical protein
MSASVIDPGKLRWHCECGAWVYNHYVECVACGRDRPVPEEEPPSDLARPELDVAGWGSGIWHFLPDGLYFNGRKVTFKGREVLIDDYVPGSPHRLRGDG